tara:strand:- start:1605 stop:1802 length:198 start_codon:yes stop_codon:yes gene_type:complete
MESKTKTSLKYVNLNNTRDFKETYSEYRKRLKENYYKIKWYIRGEQIWDSMSKGTYLIKKHGNIK